MRNIHQKDSNTELGKLPPQAIELETVLLGALMLEQDAYFKICDLLKADCFYKESHQIVYKAIQTLVENKVPVDILTVSEELTRTKQFKKIGGVLFISKLTDNVASASNIVYHARIIKQMFLKREAIRIGGDLITKAYDPTIDVADLVDDIQNQALDISKDAYTTNGISDTKDCIDSSHDSIKKRIENFKKGILPGISSGNHNLDKVTGKLQNGEFTIIAARPSVGKTLLGINQAMVSVKEGKHVVFFSLEMTKVQIMDRMITSYGINGLDLRDGKINPDEELIIEKFYDDLRQKNIKIIDKGGISAQYVISTVKNINRKRKVDMVIIDYLQLLSAPGKGDRREQLGFTSGQIKALALELDIPIIGLAQLNRDSTKENKRPTMDQLRESGTFEQDADRIMLLHKPNFYNDENIADSNDDPITNRDMLIIIAKNRTGETGEVKVTWGNFVTRMYDYHMSPDYTGIKEIMKPTVGVLDYSAGLEDVKTDFDTPPF